MFVQKNGLALVLQTDSKALALCRFQDRVLHLLQCGCFSASWVPCNGAWVWSTADAFKVLLLFRLWLGFFCVCFLVCLFACLGFCLGFVLVVVYGVLLHCFGWLVLFLPPLEWSQYFERHLFIFPVFLFIEEECWKCHWPDSYQFNHWKRGGCRSQGHQLPRHLTLQQL